MRQPDSTLLWTGAMIFFQITGSDQTRLEIGFQPLLTQAITPAICGHP
jgi:hypothetical protein